MSTLKLGLLISATGGKRTVAELLAIEAAAKKTAESTERFAGLASALNSNVASAEKLAKALNKTPEELQAAIATLQKLRSAGASNDQVFVSLAAKFGLTVKEAKKLEAELRNIPAQAPSISALGGGIGELAFKFNNVIQAIQTLAMVAKPAYDLLIGSNERLNQQLLSSQTNLASATRIFEGDREVTDPTAKILATRPALESALKQIEKDTESLVGVTSQEVNQLFQVTLQNAAALNNQSKKFPDPIKAATSLTKGWAASLQVVGIPLFQANQEINSILRGQIDQNSLLAKNLNITNEQVRKWQSQGVLVDELNKRLETFVAGNAIAARSIAGMGSNIQDILERLGRDAGAPFLEPIISALEAIFNYLKANEGAIRSFTQQIATEFLKFGSEIGPALAPLGQTLLEIAENAGGPLLAALKGLLSVASGLITALAPIANILAGIVAQLAAFANTDIGGIAVQAAVATLALGKLGAMMGSLISAFPLLSGAFATLSTTSIPAAIAAFTQFSTIAIGSAQTAIASLTAGGIPGLIAGLSKLSASLLAASTAAAPLAAALLPLAGAIAVTFLVKGAKDLENAQEEIDTLGNSTENLTQESLNYAQKLSNLAKAQKANGSLTEEQKRQQAGYAQQARSTISAINDQIAALKEAKPANEAQANQIQLQVAQLERQKALLEKIAGSIRIQAKELPTLGTSYEQLAKKAESSTRAIAQAQSSEEAGKAAQENIDAIQQQQELGQITAEQAQAALAELANNKKLEVDVQQKAQAEITRIRKSELDLQVNDLKSQSDLIAAEAEAGKRPPVAAAEEVTRLKKQQLDLQLADVKEAIADEEAAIAAGRGSKSRLKELQSQQKGIQADQAKEAVDGEKRVQDARIKEVEDSYSKETEIAKGAELAKITEITKLQLQGTLSSEQAEGQKLQATKNRIEAELNAERTKAAALAQITATTPDQQKKLESQKRDSAKKIAQLEADSVKTEMDIRKNALAQITSETEKATRKLQVADKERLADLAEAEQRGVITKSEAEAQKAQLTTDRLKKELELERTTLAQLEKQPPSEERNNAILSARQRLADKRIAIVEAEAQREEQIRRAVLDRIEKANREALDKVQLAGQERAIATQRLINQGLLSEQDAGKVRVENQQQQYRAELSAAQQQQSALQQLLGQARTGKQREEAEKSVTEARKKTNDLTLKLLESEQAAQKATVDTAIAGIEKELAERNRAFDAQLTQLATVRQERAANTADAELSAQREISASEIITKSLDRQNQLLQAKANLLKATSDAAQTELELGVGNLDRAVELRKALDDQRISQQERVVIQAQLNRLGIDGETSIYAIVQQRQQLENALAAQKRAALLQEQQQAKSALELETRRNELASARAVTEARIAEIKAKAALLDAQATLQEQRVSGQKAIDAAQAELEKAQAGKDQGAIDAAQFQLQQTEQQAALQQRQAQTAIQLAQEQASLAGQNVKETISQQQAQAEIEKMARATLEIQQQTALKQFEAAEAARIQAQQLALARAEAEGIAAAAERTKAAQSSTQSSGAPQPVARRYGGDVQTGTTYEVAEAGAEMYRSPSGDYLIPDRGLYQFPEDGRILNARQTAAVMGGGLPTSAGRLPIPEPSQNAASDRTLINEIRGLRQEVANRPSAKAEIPVTFGSPDTQQWDQFLKLQRSLMRGI